MPDALVVDDEKLTLRYLAKLLSEEGFAVRTATSFDEASSELKNTAPDVLLVDLVLRGHSGLDLLKGIRSRTALEVVVITGNASVDTAVESLQLGASDYLTKPIDETRLKAIVRNVLRIRRLQEQVGSLQEQLRSLGGLGSLMGKSASIRRVYGLVSKVAPTQATVLITGESGSGKEMVAKTIHDFSQRRNGPFLAVNCGAITPSLIESELFGHEEGSFTGAKGQRKGHFERAHGGTLFLDEIAEMPLELQVKLLRVLESGTFLRVGGNQQVEVDVRLVAATNRPPGEAIAAGKLREDLFYRLNVFSIEVPPLRERPEDIELLAVHFLSECNGDPGSSKWLHSEAVERLKTHSWPGNVRELKNVIRRAFIVASDVILPGCFPEQIQQARRNDASVAEMRFEVGTPLAEVERRAILATLEHYGGNRKQAAKALQMNLRTLYNRLKAYRGVGNGGSSQKAVSGRSASEAGDRPET